jgi:integrase
MTIVKRGNSLRVVVRVTGQKPATRTFAKDEKAQALLWEEEQKLRMNSRKQFTRGVTLGMLCRRYRDEVEKPDPTTTKGEIAMSNRFAIDFAETDLSEMTKKWWMDTVEGWHHLKPSSRTRYMWRINAVLRVAAEKEWNSCKVDWKSFSEAYTALEKKGAIDGGDPRARRVSQVELDLLKNRYRGSSPQLLDIIDFAVILGLRQGEIAKLTWSDIKDADTDEPMLLVKKRKNPKKKITGLVPLLDDSLQILQRQPRPKDLVSDQRIFRMDAQQIYTAFHVLVRTLQAEGKLSKAEEDDLRFHDLRHEALSRLFERGFSIPEVQLVSGHKEWESLKIYTNLKPSGLHQGPLAHQQLMNDDRQLEKLLENPKLRAKLIVLLNSQEKRAA